MDTNSNPNADIIIDKLNQIFELICDITKEDQGLGLLLKEFYTLSLNTAAELQETGDRTKIDISQHIKIISNVLGVDVRDLMEEVLKEVSGQQIESNKEADVATLEFITSDLDDYEKFIAQNKAKESLDFLSKEI
jgi:hypothetical protein